MSTIEKTSTAINELFQNIEKLTRYIFPGLSFYVLLLYFNDCLTPTKQGLYFSLIIGVIWYSVHQFVSIFLNRVLYRCLGTTWKDQKYKEIKKEKITGKFYFNFARAHFILILSEQLIGLSLINVKCIVLVIGLALFGLALFNYYLLVRDNFEILKKSLILYQK